MNSVLRAAVPLYVLIVVTCLLLVPALSKSAHAQCAYTVCKSAPELTDSEELIFNFFVTQGGLSVIFQLAANSECTGDAFSGSNLEILEEPKPGWILDHVECSDSELVTVTPIENGVSLDCLGGSEITCTFINVRGSETNIPTLSEWGMIAAAAGLAIVGAFFALRRRKVRTV